MPDNALDENPLPQPGVSGKSVTLSVLALLFIIGGTLSYALWCYSALERARAKKLSSWSAVRDGLDARYRKIEKDVATRTDNESVPMEWAEQFRLALDGFRTTAQLADQHRAAQRVEDLLVEAKSTLGSYTVQPPLEDAVQTFNRQVDNEASELTSPGCQLLSIFLPFDQPQRLNCSDSSDTDGP